MKFWVYVGVLDELLWVGGVDRLKGGLVVLDELQLQLSLGLMPFVDEVFLVDHVGQIVVLGGDGAFPELAHKRKEKEVRRGDPLLAIDDDACVGAICLGDDASKEMTLHAFGNDILEVVEQLLAVFDLPVVVALIHGDNETGLRTLKQIQQISFFAFQMLSFQEEYKPKTMMRILIDSDGLEVDVIIELCDGRRTALLEQITSRLTGF